jgi:Bacterial capsule synthesis protein PGA_cap
MRGVVLAVRAGVVVALIAVVTSLLVDGAPTPAVAQLSASPPPAKQTAPPKRAAAKRSYPPGVVTISAVGDIVMGSTPALPPDGGRSFFSRVAADLPADIVLGNLEGTLTTASGSKCGPSSTNCFAFRTPPSYARWLKRAGFTVLNVANNHAYDFGAAGLTETVKTLDRFDLAHTGRPGEVASSKAGKIRVATLGFASYPWSNPLTDLAAVRRLVKAADKRADVVVVTAHMGAEGTAHQHVRRGTETYLGEDRGDPMRFARTAVDAGADLVVGSGPHVLRGMEWYKGRLIAYSLGNFGGYKVFALGGPLSVSGILRVTLRGDGAFEAGVLVPTRLDGNGIPQLDPAEQAHGIVRSLSQADFGRRAVSVSREGVLGRR